METKHLVKQDDLINTIKQLTLACDSLMGELIGKGPVANWGLINDALVGGNKAITKATKED